MPQVRIHGYLISTWTQTACMTCVEKGIAYELVAVPYGSERHGELHPFRRIPILEAGGKLVTESLAITGYLDEAFDGPVLQPATAAARVRMRTWMGVCADYLFRDAVRGIPRDRPASADERAGARMALERAERMIDDGPFLLGEQVSLADLYLAPQLGNCLEKAPELLDGLEALSRFRSLFERRESYLATRP